LLLFAAMILRGWLAGNSLEVILSRALAGLFFGVLIGALVGWAATRAIVEWIDATRVAEAASSSEPENKPSA
jgi:NhaP-type Na+/H+ or K+/H+ antiporter